MGTPSSNYPQFDVNEYDLGVLVGPLPGITVKVYDVTNAVDLDDLTANGDGIVVAGTLPVAAGTVVRFRVENYLGKAGAWQFVTTA